MKKIHSLTKLSLLGAALAIPHLVVAAEFPPVAFSGVLEVEASSYDDKIADEQGSDIALATVELAADATISDRVSAHLLILYEDSDDDNVLVDEGFVTITGGEGSPFSLVAGRQYLPFGNFESQMVSDPLTVDLAETREDALLVGYKADGLYGSAYLFNGDAEKDGSDDKVDRFGANIGHRGANDRISWDFGVGYINSIADSDANQEMLADPAVPDTIEEYTPGLSAHLIMGLGPVTVIGEYVTATKKFNSADLGFAGGDAKPSAANIEIGYGFELFGREANVAVGHQRTAESFGLGLVESRNLAAVAMSVAEGTSLGLEYRQEKDYGTGDGGSGEKFSAVTALLAVEF